MSGPWRLEELAGLVAKALDAAPYNGQPSGRVRAVPDVRTIRYYTTLGILDRPLEMRGRTAFYGPRHLLQLVATKRLQSRGLSLVAIQQALTGADEAALSQLADLPRGFIEEVSAAELAPDQSATERQPFWVAIPAAPEPQPDRPIPPMRPSTVIELGPGVSLLIDGRLARQLDASQLADVQAATTAFVEALKRSDVLR